MKAVGKNEKNKKQGDNKMGEGDRKLKENAIGKIVEQDISEHVNLFKNKVVNA